jgi:hypothetical protein
MPRGVAPNTHGLNESAAAVLRETQPATLGSVCSQLLMRSGDAVETGGGVTAQTKCRRIGRHDQPCARGAEGA